MRLTIPPLTIDDDNPFKNDVLNRKKFAESLFGLISNIDDNLVISLSAPWGEGKTTFIKMWQGLLKEKGISTIYFDAFAHDYLDDPFICIASEIATLITHLDAEDPLKSRASEFKKKAAKAGVQLLSWGAKLAVKASTLGIIKEVDFEALNEIKNDISKGTSGFISKYIEEKLDAHQTDIEALDIFRSQLERLANDIKESTGYPLVFIIDELDRCKPSFAIHLIENIKHIFSVDKLVFVIVMNREQLEEHVRCVYGRNVDAKTYLQKFIHVNFSLPKNVFASMDDYSKYCYHLIKEHQLFGTSETAYREPTKLTECISPWARHFRLSLRDLEKCFINIVLFCSFHAISVNGIDSYSLMGFLAILKDKRPDIFERLRISSISYEDVLESINFKDAKNILAEHSSIKEVLENVELLCMSETALRERASTTENGISNSRLHQLSSRRQIAQSYCDSFDLFSRLD